MEQLFRFKGFSVDQTGCAMRINTDGVILGAWATAVAPVRILDIGTGTGIIALMLAQRFPGARIDAVELEAKAAATAGNNFANAPFAQRLQVFQGDILTFRPEKSYDMLIANPPFFVGDLKNTEARKRLARHAAADFFEGLLLKALELLNPRGIFWLILPARTADDLCIRAADMGLFLQTELNICSDASKPVIRKIVSLGRQKRGVERKTFCIYEGPGQYTAAYRELLKAFFLAF